MQKFFPLPLVLLVVIPSSREFYGDISTSSDHSEVSLGKTFLEGTILYYMIWLFSTDKEIVFWALITFQMPSTAGNCCCWVLQPRNLLHYLEKFPHCSLSHLTNPGSVPGKNWTHDLMVFPMKQSTSGSSI